MTPPEGLTILDCEAILAQAVDADACYRVDGWILRAMADELLAWKSGTMPRRKPARRRDRPLFEAKEEQPR